MTGTVPDATTGAAVVDANGQRVATVVRVDDGVPYVDPAAGVDPTTRLALGWERDSPPHRLVPAHVESATEDRIDLRANL